MALGDCFKDPGTGLEFEIVWDGSRECSGIYWDPDYAASPRPVIQHLLDQDALRNSGSVRKVHKSTLEKAKAELKRLTS